MITVEDPDLQIRMGEGGGHPDPEMRGGGAASKRIFVGPLGFIWSKNKGGGGAGPWAPPLDRPMD